MLQARGQDATSGKELEGLSGQQQAPPCLSATASAPATAPRPHPCLPSHLPSPRHTWDGPPPKGDVDIVVPGCEGDVLHGTAAIFVVLAGHLGFRGALNG